MIMRRGQLLEKMRKRKIDRGRIQKKKTPKRHSRVLLQGTTMKKVTGRARNPDLKLKIPALVLRRKVEIKQSRTSPGREAGTLKADRVPQPKEIKANPNRFPEKNGSEVTLAVEMGRENRGQGDAAPLENDLGLQNLDPDPLPHKQAAGCLKQRLEQMKV